MGVLTVSSLPLSRRQASPSFAEQDSVRAESRAILEMEFTAPRKTCTQASAAPLGTRMSS